MLTCHNCVISHRTFNKTLTMYNNSNENFYNIHLRLSKCDNE